MRASAVGLRGLCAACLCAVVAAAPLAMTAQDATFHVDVRLVNIFVNVTDKNGSIVGGLTRTILRSSRTTGCSKSRCSRSSRKCR